tara:strand:+ start:1081 stop:1281 length:201 start_codon:yes stop_codon:yes gene_type:complete
MNNKAKEVYGNKPKLDRATKRKLKRKIDKDIKAGKYDDLKAAIKKDREDNDDKPGGLNTDGSNYNG